MKPKILDCTLRDGGYYTNWDFDETIVEQYIQHTNNIPIDYIGLRPGEKMFEELITKGAKFTDSPHEKIMILKNEVKHGWNQTLAESEKVVISSKSYNADTSWDFHFSLEAFNVSKSKFSL